MDLSTTIAGVKFPSCFMNASGALCMTREELLALGRECASNLQEPWKSIDHAELLYDERGLPC